MTDKKSETNAQEPDRTLFEPNLLPKFTFDTFFVGDCNRFAHAADLKVAESPGVTYNPLFIHDRQLRLGDYSPHAGNRKQSATAFRDCPHLLL